MKKKIWCVPKRLQFENRQLLYNLPRKEQASMWGNKERRVWVFFFFLGFLISPLTLNSWRPRRIWCELVRLLVREGFTTRANFLYFRILRFLWQTQNPWVQRTDILERACTVHSMNAKMLGPERVQDKERKRLKTREKCSTHVHVSGGRLLT